ncbi:MAG: DUF134 domain-containing protein [Bacteroidales bacterium]|nr:DUF134 domain-containing protein [Bacteroidales bacterium]
MNRRSRRRRKVLNPPPVQGYRPYGGDPSKSENFTQHLLLEEYEAIRLCDYEMYTHEQASVIMGVSRPTFTRIYASARQKIAKCLVEGLQIKIEGGEVFFDSDWYHCKSCNIDFSNPDKTQEVKECPLCSGTEIKHYGEQNKAMYHHDEVCKCSACGFEQDHKRGVPCNVEICPKCGSKMFRKQKDNN